MNDLRELVGSRPFDEQDLREMTLRLAHEIRNPLATIKSGVQLVAHLTRPDDTIGEYFESILLEVTRIDRTVREMQKYVRTTAGNPRAVGMREGVEDALAPLREEQGAGERLAVPGGPDAAVHIDRDQLVQAVAELAGNALQFSPAGSPVELSWEPVGGLVLLHVDDRGAGLTREELRRVARPFYSSSTQGTGLGLNLVDKICRLAGGKLLHRTRQGGGNRFTLSLPEAG